MADPKPDGGGSLKQKVGGLPMWGWVGLAASAGIVVMVWRQRGKKTEPTPSQQQPIVEASGLATEQASSIYSLLRTLQGTPSTPLPAPPSGETLQAPSNIRVEPSAGSGRIILFWNPVNGAVRYWIAI